MIYDHNDEPVLEIEDLLELEELMLNADDAVPFLVA